MPAHTRGALLIALAAVAAVALVPVFLVEDQGGVWVALEAALLLVAIGGGLAGAALLRRDRRETRDDAPARGHGTGGPSGH